jgi:hypothetical protein
LLSYILLNHREKKKWNFTVKVNTIGLGDTIPSRKEQASHSGGQWYRQVKHCTAVKWGGDISQYREGRSESRWEPRVEILAIGGSEEGQGNSSKFKQTGRLESRKGECRGE